MVIYNMSLHSFKVTLLNTICIRDVNALVYIASMLQIDMKLSLFHNSKLIKHQKIEDNPMKAKLV
jgi:hypothetical protein